MKGFYRVTTFSRKKPVARDFDAEEWSHEWLKRNEVAVLRLLHDSEPGAKDSFDFVEFSVPISIEFVREE